MAQSELTSGESEPAISYPWLSELLLNYKLSQHVQFLNRFREAFRRFDQSNKGMVPAAKLPQLLKLLDPRLSYNHSKVVKEASALRRSRLTLTDVVNLLAGAEPTSPDTNHSLLEAINVD